LTALAFNEGHTLFLQEPQMKLLALLLATAGLSGCVAYGSPYGPPYGGVAPGYYYGQGGYYSPYTVEPQSLYIYGGGYRSGPGYQGRRDRDRDGIADRFDRDRDGDGIPNRRDRHPSDPRRN
jgi:hypothetical protein